MEEDIYKQFVELAFTFQYIIVNVGAAVFELQKFFSVIVIYIDV